MKDPIQVEFAQVFIQPSAGPQGLPMLILKFPHGTVSFDLSDHKRGRIRKLNNTAAMVQTTPSTKDQLK